MPDSNIRRVKVIDSHTGGEPTRVVISGGPDLGSDTLATRLRRFREQYDDFRSAVVNEPRGSDAMVGALLCASLDNSCITGVIYFNNVAYLGMCGRGTIGVVATPAYLGGTEPGTHRLDTPDGIGTAKPVVHGVIETANVPS